MAGGFRGSLRCLIVEGRMGSGTVIAAWLTACKLCRDTGMLSFSSLYPCWSLLLSNT